jgi:hypothetical protein
VICIFDRMAVIEVPKKTAEGNGLAIPQPPGPFVKAACFLNRPILIGLAAFLSLLGCCQAYGGSVGTSYQRANYADLAPVPPHDDTPNFGTGSSESDAVPLLFLSFVGLAGMALSRTKSSRDDRH